MADDPIVPTNELGLSLDAPMLNSVSVHEIATLSDHGLTKPSIKFQLRRRGGVVITGQGEFDHGPHIDFHMRLKLTPSVFFLSYHLRLIESPGPSDGSAGLHMIVGPEEVPILTLPMPRRFVSFTNDKTEIRIRFLFKKGDVRVVGFPSSPGRKYMVTSGAGLTNGKVDFVTDEKDFKRTHVLLTNPELFEFATLHAGPADKSGFDLSMKVGVIIE